MSTQGENYYHTDDPTTLTWLIGVLQNALDNGQSVRFYTSDQTLIVKRGEGVWAGPLKGTPDVYRDSVDKATVQALETYNSLTGGR